MYFSTFVAMYFGTPLLTATLVRTRLLGATVWLSDSQRGAPLLCLSMLGTGADCGGGGALEALGRTSARGRWPGLGKCLAGQGTVGLDEPGASTVVFVLIYAKW